MRASQRDRRSGHDYRNRLHLFCRMCDAAGGRTFNRGLRGYGGNCDRLAARYASVLATVTIYTDFITDPLKLSPLCAQLDWLPQNSNLDEYRLHCTRVQFCHAFSQCDYQRCDIGLQECEHVCTSCWDDSICRCAWVIVDGSRAFLFESSKLYPDLLRPQPNSLLPVRTTP
jgi:hypothetical protein